MCYCTFTLNFFLEISEHTGKAHYVYFYMLLLWAVPEFLCGSLSNPTVDFPPETWVNPSLLTQSFLLNHCSLLYFAQSEW